MTLKSDLCDVHFTFELSLAMWAYYRGEKSNRREALVKAFGDPYGIHLPRVDTGDVDTDGTWLIRNFMAVNMDMWNTPGRGMDPAIQDIHY